MTTRIIIAVDPGDVHVGFAVFRHTRSFGWVCDSAREVDPETYVNLITSWIQEHEAGRYRVIIVMEDWMLYGKTAMAQVGQRFGAVQLIGYTRHRVEWGASSLPFVLQPASIKKGTVAWAKTRGYLFRSVAQKKGGHAKDAEIHGLHYLVRTLRTDAVTWRP